MSEEENGRRQATENEFHRAPEFSDDSDDVSDLPDPEIDREDIHHVESRIENVRLAQSYIHAIKSANLDNDKLTPEEIHRLRNPDTQQVDVDDPDIRLSIDIYMACSNASESTYKAVHDYAGFRTLKFSRTIVSRLLLPISLG